MDNPVVATIKVELNQDGTYMVVGCLDHRDLALSLLDRAKAQVMKYHADREVAHETTCP